MEIRLLTCILMIASALAISVVNNVMFQLIASLFIIMMMAININCDKE